MLRLVRHSVLEANLRLLPQDVQVVNGTVQIADALVLLLLVLLYVAHVRVTIVVVRTRLGLVDEGTAARLIVLLVVLWHAVVMLGRIAG